MGLLGSLDFQIFEKRELKRMFLQVREEYLVVGGYARALEKNVKMIALPPPFSVAVTIQ
jgi:hypothetical protein